MAFVEHEFAITLARNLHIEIAGSVYNYCVSDVCEQDTQVVQKKSVMFVPVAPGSLR